ncbi:unnamed protein product [Psylliodes chrysocephalus]|uniref:Epoxide hydrolase n=1 Tax=Psylliodes chrysocephalus TaxID=3402493 RepID=A0A9P0CCT4_9CUCU|nr:unnamed protein product [Psylliodes chrysocephala]
MKITIFIAITGALSFTVIYNYCYNFIYFDGRPGISDDFCWGKKENCKNDTNIYSFKINIRQEEIDDLISRLNNTRQFISRLENTQTQYGVSGQILEVIRKFVMEEYNFTQRLIYLNKYPQFKTKIQGLNIHFLHIKPKNRRDLPVIPILLLHGWPSSVREFYESVPSFMSDNRQYAIELVIPTLPGFGYSDGATKPNCRTAHIANMLKILMDRLGYKRYVVHGSDWGAVVATNMATLYPENVIGFHSNFCFSFRVVTLIKILLAGLYPSAAFDDKYVNKLYPLSEYFKFLMSEAAYLHLMGTKSDTIGLEHFDLTKIMDIILFYYWFPQKAATSSRIYSENLSLNGLLEGLHNIPIHPSVLCKCVMFENEFFFLPENFLRDKYTNLVGYDIYPGIGHFAAIEANDILTEDIISFVERFFVKNS